MDQQACMDLMITAIEQAGTTVLWPLVVTIGMIVIIPMVMLLWPQKRFVDLVLTQNTEGRIIGVEFIKKGWKRVQQARKEVGEEEVA